jgi:hypothetical protein
MTGRLGKVSHCERTIKGDDGTPVVNVFVELGDDGHPETVTAELLAEPGVDALPLPGDEAMIEEAEGQGETSINAFADPKNAGKAEPGERRIYARDASGKVVFEVWIKGDGSGSLINEKGKFTLLADGSLDHNDGAFTCDPQGNAAFKGEVTAMAQTTPVRLSTHLHGTGVGPTTAPTPGT